MLRTHFLAALLLAGSVAANAQDGHEHHAGDHGPAPGALGTYPMSREASGTSWQPDAAPMAGLHFAGEEWTTMLHGYADTVYDRQGGPRGDEKVFVASMLMAMGQRRLGPGTLGLRGMASLDPLMGKAGYPLLLQTGETADGVEHLVDRQHPHDFLMELAATYSVPLAGGSLFGYAGLPGEPALGPPAFMHRASGLAIPEAPLTHHWLDSTHITFGVVTLGATAGRWKMEASAFNGREPDQYRWNVETGSFDSAAGRLSFNPSADWSTQISYGYLASPEQLHPDESVHRLTASASHTRRIAGGQWSSTLAAGVNRSGGNDRPAGLLESVRQQGRLTLFGRAELVRNGELVHAGPLAGREFDVGKLTLGGSWRLGRWRALAFDAGALGSAYSMPGALEPEYGSSPVSGMVFVRTALE